MDLIVRVNYKKGYEDLGEYRIDLDDYENCSVDDLNNIIKELVNNITNYKNVKSIKRVCLYQRGELVRIIRNK